MAETHEVPGVFTNPIFPAKCGADGSTVYVRLFNPNLNMPATRINADRKGFKSFGLDGTRYFGHAHIWDFAPAPNGGAYLLIGWRFQDEAKLNKGYSVLSFDGDGRMKRDAVVDGVPFDPLQIAAFRDGTLMVAGRATSERGGHRGTPGIAMINESGRLLKVIKIEHDVEPPKPESVKDSAETKAKAPDTDGPSEQERLQEHDLSLDLSMAQSADDGNVYVVRQSSTGPLFQISPGGTLREIKLPGYEGGKINSAMVARGRLLLHYVKDESLGQSDLGLYSEYDLATMQKTRDYRVQMMNPLANAMQGCYSGDQISFLKIRSLGRLFVLVSNLQ